MNAPTRRDVEVRPDLPIGFDWTHGCIDEDEPIIAWHTDGTEDCRVEWHEFSTVGAAERWARTHECAQ